ncbi:hypothetical protein NMS_1134 [Nonlabens marinus S1-08]|uniref:Uncharacterized protein n=1 Tax=Nonlabens marinus S1-08 TaxID=1454201 RepID=W8VV55_9FLAO|nr:hypothetical protein NMS_1134 [Nonlabens marinus S1-08]
MLRTNWKVWYAVSIQNGFAFLKTGDKKINTKGKTLPYTLTHGILYQY